MTDSKQHSELFALVREYVGHREMTPQECDRVEAALDSIEEQLEAAQQQSSERLAALLIAWDLIRPNYPPMIEHTTEEKAKLLQITTTSGFDEAMRQQIKAEIDAEDASYPAGRP